MCAIKQIKIDARCSFITGKYPHGCGYIVYCILSEIYCSFDFVFSNRFRLNLGVWLELIYRDCNAVRAVIKYNLFSN